MIAVQHNSPTLCSTTPQPPSPSLLISRPPLLPLPTPPPPPPPFSSSNRSFNSSTCAHLLEESQHNRSRDFVSLSRQHNRSRDFVSLCHQTPVSLTSSLIAFLSTCCMDGHRQDSSAISAAKDTAVWKDMIANAGQRCTVVIA